MRRALCVFASPPYPPDSGMRHRNWNLLRAGASEYDTTILTWAPSERGRPALDDGVRDALGSVASEVVVLPAAAPQLDLASRLRRRARMWAGDVPSYVQVVLEERGLRRGEGRARLAATVAARHRDRPFDHVVLWEEALAAVPLPDLGVPVVLHRHNVFARVVPDVMRRRPVWRAVWALEGRRWREFDRRVMRAADLVITPSAESAAWLGALAPATALGVVGTGAQARAMSTPVEARRDVAFVGWMRYHANVDAVRWFARECWPALRRRFADSTFRIVGREPGPEVLRLAGRDVRVTGEVPDVAEALEGVRVGVVPLWSGMGVKTKTLEMLGMGLPVVSTPAGAEGLRAGPDDGLVVARTAAEFVDAVAALLGDAATATRLGEAARAYVGREHSWEGVGAEYRALLAGLADLREAPSR